MTMVSKWPLLIFLVQGFTVNAQANQDDTDLKLWYNKPATIWEEALPLGNGTTGAMVFGGTGQALYQLNDNTLWSGFPDPGNNPNGTEYLPLIREAVSQGAYGQAEEYWKKMQGPYSARYLPLGDLSLDFGNPENPSAYHRELDLTTAIASESYGMNGVDYHRESFISHPDQVMVVQITANKEHAINFKAGLRSKLHYELSVLSDNTLVLRGKAPKHVAHRKSEPQQIRYEDPLTGEGMNFEIRLKVRQQGGTLSAENNQLKITGANRVTLYITEATSFNGFDRSPGTEGKDPSVEATARMRKAFSKSFRELKKSHMEDYRSLFKRVDLDLGADREDLELPTDARLMRFGQGEKDNQLLALYYQFGRYLLISCSRKGAVPANLQGIWNPHVQPPWGSNYTININTQMNYWLAENTNLSECHEPLFGFIENLAKNGAVTAAVNYGIEEGWTAHHNSDIWAKTSPTGGYEWDPKSSPRWAAWPMGGAWLSTHMWEHFLYTGDMEFLRDRAYPVLKGAAEFMLSWLVPDKEGHLVTIPSVSPENQFNYKGQQYSISMASTMDMAIIRNLFSACIKAHGILGLDDGFATEVKSAMERLYPYHIGQFGQLQEWFRDWDDPKDEHRHLSHLFGLFPGSEINLEHAPQLAAAAKQSLLLRGDAGTGWSMAWKINWWARLRDGEHAYKILRSGLTYINPVQNEVKMTGGGTYPNLFDAHPPFQIDGNLGGTAGITEMLMQSHNGSIALLPALPTEWSQGRIQGIKARGNFRIDMGWKDHRVTEVVIFSGNGGNCRIWAGNRLKVMETSSVEAKGDNSNPLTQESPVPPIGDMVTAPPVTLRDQKGYTVDFMTEKGKSYTLVPYGGVE